VTDDLASSAAGWLLAIDTGTSRIVVAAGRPDGSLIRVMDWPAGHRHGELLLAGVEELLDATGLRRGDLAGIVVGTGPGAFTGLRVGLATAKTLAHALGLPIAGVSTGEALLRAAGAAVASGAAPGSGGVVEARLALVLPAGPHDRVLVRPGVAPELLPGGAGDGVPTETVLVAVDLPARAPEAAIRRGEAARDGLGAALLELGAARLRAGQADDAAQLVPEYVTLPRGVRASVGEIAWSHDPR
jgi:tRNA threonylcarbamoyl adenosine modification protein YeaZ